MQKEDRVHMNSWMSGSLDGPGASSCHVQQAEAFRGTSQGYADLGSGVR